MSRSIKRFALIAGVLAALSLTAAPAIAAPATVIIGRGNFDCDIAPGDLPGLTFEFAVANSTVVIHDDGSLNVTCHGVIPSGYPLSATFAGDVICSDGVRLGSGHIVGTKSGQLAVACHLPPDD